MRKPTWSIFSRASKPLASPAPETSHPQFDVADTDLLNLSDPTRRLRPVQFAPSRLATLYISRSERDLYLAAMSDLDNPPPLLPLWSEPPPALPTVARVEPLSPRPPTWLGTYPASPKLVTSPDSGAHGLLVRDEFRRVAPRLTQHALLTFTAPNRLTFLNFPVPALVAADEAVRKTWPHGVRGSTETVDSLQKKAEGTRDGISWSIDVNGTVWIKKGNEELESIRLILAVLTALGTCGWALVDNLQAALAKNDSHNLLFAHSPDTAAIPPLYFAVTLPLPDRISIISPPPKTTPALISAVRNAILTVNGTGYTAHASASAPAAGSGHGSVNGPSPTNSKPKTKNMWGKKRGVKLEGWVHPGVYRFWMGGLRRFPGGRLRKGVIAAIHPPLILNIVDTLSMLHFTLAASLPLLPLVKGRDVLIFQSLPSSGMSCQDAYVIDRQSMILPTAPESPVLVSPELPDVDAQGNILNAPAIEARPDGLAPSRPDPRRLPWDSSVAATPLGNDQMSEVAPLRPSVDSNRRLIAADHVTGSPKHRNVLLKKDSVRRKEVAQQHAGSRQGSRKSSDATPLNGAGEGEWELVPPGEVVASAQVASQLGLSPPQAFQEPVTVAPARSHPPQTHQNFAPRRSEDGGSVYTDASAHVSHPLRLGSPMRDSGPLDPLYRVPVQDSTQVTNAGHVESSYGSIGHFGGSVFGTSEAGLDTTIPAPQSARTVGAHTAEPHTEHVVYPAAHERPASASSDEVSLPGFEHLALRLPTQGEVEPYVQGVGSARTRMVIS
ncbi:hypothetical protein Q5752_006780 [Cryptotrichosporon argae]